MRRRLLAMVASALACAGLAVAVPAASAGTYPPGGATVTSSSATPRPGELITLTAQGFCPGSTVEFRLVGPAPSTATVVLGSVVADGAGVAVLQVNVPATEGAYTVVANANGPGVDCAKTTSTGITVTAPPTPGTGSDTGTLLTAGAIVLGVGLCLFLVARARRGRPRPATA